MPKKGSPKVLVTGGAGFIGSHLVERLLANGHAVTVLDNYSNGTLSNLDDIKDDRRITIQQVDIADYRRIKPYFEGIDWVFHLAALADIVPGVTTTRESCMTIFR